MGKYFSHFFWILSTFIGLPSILLVVRDLGLYTDFAAPLVDALNSWKAWLAFLDLPIIYLVEPALTALSNLLSLNLRVADYWKAFFLILFVDAASTAKISWRERNDRWITGADLFFRVVGSLLASIILGIFVSSGNPIAQAFAAYFVKFISSFFIIASPVFSLLTIGFFSKRPKWIAIDGESVYLSDYLKEMIFFTAWFSSLYFIFAAVLSASETTESYACLIVVLGSSVFNAATNILVGLRNGTDRDVLLGLTVFGGYFAATLVVLLDSVLG